MAFRITVARYPCPSPARSPVSRRHRGERPQDGALRAGRVRPEPRVGQRGRI